MQDRPAQDHPRPQQSPAAPGLAGIWEFLCSLPERARRPETLLMLMAMLASLGAHMPPWLGLGALADYWRVHEAEEARSKPVEVSFNIDETTPTDETPPEPEPPPPKPKKMREKPRSEPEKARVTPPEKPKQEVRKVVVRSEPAPPPEPEVTPERKQSVTQKSADPNVEPPPDAKYLAEENQRVAEETVAMARSAVRDDPVPQKEPLKEPEGERGAPSEEEEEPAPTPSHRAPPEASEPTRPEVAVRPTPAPAPSPAPSTPAPAIAPGTVIHDALGSFTLVDPRGSDGPPSARRASAAAPNLAVSWRSFEDTYGAEALARDRMPKSEKRLGAGREKRWSEFRAAAENYVVGVRPGNQTALNAAADPFAAYLAAFHRNLHMEFAHEFLASLPMTGDLGRYDLMTLVEIVVNADGSLDRVGIVKSSGQTMYDFGAFNAVQRGAPYPPPPDKIRSADGRVYMRWALHRNESQCGTWNAQPFILKTPPRSPNDPTPDHVSPFRGPEGGEHGRGPSHAPPAAVHPGEKAGFLERRREGALG